MGSMLPYMAYMDPMGYKCYLRIIHYGLFARSYKPT